MTHTRKQHLLDRLNAIGQGLQNTGGLALLGLGSAGSETDRMDDYSDLDFFAIVPNGQKQRFIHHLDWMSAAHPIAYQFQNTADGHKLLYADGIFCEFAVFEAHELARIPYAAPRIVWADPDFDARLVAPPPVHQNDSSEAWHVGEAITNLYVGLCRYRRGEKLSAFRFIQSYAIDRVVSLAAKLHQREAGFVDPFGAERRNEQLYPALAGRLPSMMQGYDRTPESALAILAFLSQHFDINTAMKTEIERLAQ